MHLSLLTYYYSIPQRYINNLALDQHSNASSLLLYAIKKNDLAVVEFLIQQEEKYNPRNFDEVDPEEKQEFVTLENYYFDLAMSLGRTEIMGHLIARTGAEFPFSTLMKIAGVKIEKKPKVRSELAISPKHTESYVLAITYDCCSITKASPFTGRSVKIGRLRVVLLT